MNLRARAEEWLAEDPDPDTRGELQSLLDAGDEAALAERFSTRLEFGTAGIRGPLGAGPARMNRAVVRRVTAGLAGRLLEDGPAEGRSVVVGRDARRKSAEFAEDVIAVLTATGFTVRAFADPVPTPLVAYATAHLGAVAGVQITASHNPPEDNGYKVYWAGGAQIAAPLDAEISAQIAAVGALSDVPYDPSARASVIGRDLTEAYFAEILALVDEEGDRDLSIVYTPLHGVAGSAVTDILRRAGFAELAVVAEQFEPDPAFPTVNFPNPEEPGALDLAFELATRRGADLVLANDPDGDRIAAAIAGEEGWRALTGDEVGCLLAEYLLTRFDGGPERVVATTAVSSRLLSRIADHHGVGYAETLTGFKWLARAAAEAEAHGGRMVLAYEQALGVMVGTTVRDKDGISAALALAELAARLKAEGRTLADALDSLALRHGVHATAGRSVRLEGEAGTELAAETLQRLRADPPEALAGVSVAAAADYRAGVRTAADGRTQSLGTPSTDLYSLELADGSRAQLRPSGTEPLLKCYLEVVEPVPDGDVAAARDRVAPRLDALGDAFLAYLGLPAL
ncbi:MAG TPA: phospho-sugar mutase [Egibacteraceae bacterium]|nr:phospho-sugar mutase [Egibacteraceae bacterium]